MNELLQQRSVTKADAYEPGRWHTLCLRVHDRECAVSIDGKEIANWQEDEQHGTCQLSLQAQNASRVDFRNLLIRTAPLPDATRRP